MTAVAVPERSEEQRLEALGRANRVRMHRAQLKRDVKAGRKRAWGVITSGHPLVGSMPVVDVLLAVPGIGPAKVRKAFTSANVSQSKTIGGIHAQQLERLAERLREWPSARAAIF